MNQSTNFGARGLIFARFTDCDAVPTKHGRGRVWVTPKSAFPPLGEPVSLAFAHGSPHVEALALPKFVQRGNFSLDTLVIRGISVKNGHPAGAG
ncbi:MAG TPA: hypothetical protein VHT02_03500 [Methylocella sp.]|nr:hypothetical protein [Methylocella sp.]